jgi:anthranilate synthase component 1
MCGLNPDDSQLSSAAPTDQALPQLATLTSSMSAVDTRKMLPGARDLLPLAAANPQRYPCLLESVACGGAQARYDVLFAFPQDALTLHGDGRVRDAQGGDCGAHFLAALDAAWRAQRTQKDTSTHLPFGTGWAVLLGYELAQQIEPRLRLPPVGGAGMPAALALRCAATIIVDRVAGQTFLIADARHAGLIDALRSDIETAAAFVAPPLGAVAVEEDAPEQFLAGVARIHEYLRNGDTFQVNLSREWRASFAQAPSPAALYAHLRDANPSPFAGLLQWQDWAVVSSSPERLLEVRGNVVQTRPIAGTRARIAGDDDAARTRELIEHAKERAEHVMLIDLERNDLGRVCVPGSVEVNELMTVESYAHVHHIVSNVRGRLRDGVTPGQAIAAVFPGGTITGCPKVRCMEIIAELEQVGRGAYTGALGYLDRNGDMDLNILIRTLAVHGDQVRLRAGAGIVADSDAQRELDETRAKARGLLRALGSDT